MICTICGLSGSADVTDLRRFFPYESKNEIPYNLPGKTITTKKAYKKQKNTKDFQGLRPKYEIAEINPNCRPR
jgi:hypothetical protein